MTMELKRSYFSLSYHNIRKWLLTDTKNKVNVQVAKKPKIFIQTYDGWSNGWNLVTNHPFLNIICISLVVKKFLEAINFFR
jgi:hypothetical protein